MPTDEYEATGILYKKFDAEQITPRFRKRELVVELPGRYPQVVSFELTGDRCELLDEHEVGDEVTVVFRLKGREWSGRGETRYFNSLDVLELRRGGGHAAVGGPPAPAAQAAQGPPAIGGGPPPSDAPPPSDDDTPFFDEDDIPF